MLTKNAFIAITLTDVEAIQISCSYSGIIELVPIPTYQYTGFTHMFVYRLYSTESTSAMRCLNMILMIDVPKYYRTPCTGSLVKEISHQKSCLEWKGSNR
jgi:hypothetical protein